MQDYDIVYARQVILDGLLKMYASAVLGRGSAQSVFRVLVAEVVRLPVGRPAEA
jgi:hypothetical protein